MQSEMTAKQVMEQLQSIAFARATDYLQVEQGVLETSVRERLRALFAQGFLCNILNPKCTLFICGLTVGPLEQFGGQFDWYAPVLVLVASGACLVGWVLWSALLQWSPVRYFYLRHTTAIDAVFAILLAVFAVKLLLPC